MYHDLKNHMLVSQLDKAHIERLQGVMRHFERFSDSGNDILNILLWVKFNEANKLGIEIDSQITKVNFSFIDDLDLCSIWGNLLDNAIAACSEIDKTKFPKIVLCVAKTNDFIMIKIENDCVTRRKKSANGFFKTTKAEENLHGIGTKSIRRVAEKYDGTAVFESFDNRFVTQIMIPSPFKQ